MTTTTLPPARIDLRRARTVPPLATQVAALDDDLLILLAERAEVDACGR
jgi:hypothetical protein